MLNLFKQKEKSRIGLDISPEGITLAQLVMENNCFSVKNQIYKLLDPSGSISETIKSILDECRPGNLNAALAVPGNTVFIKRITLPDLPYEELKAIAPQEASKYLPLSISELNVDFQVLENSKRQDETGKKVDVILCAISKIMAKDYLSPLFEAGLGVDLLAVSSFAAIKAFANEGLINEPDKTYISVLIGYENTDINIIQNGMPVFSYNVQAGRKNLIENIMNSVLVKKDEAVNMLPEVALILPGMDMSDSPALNQASNAAKSIYNNISNEIQKTIEFFNSGNPEPLTIERIIISGSGACIQNLDKYMTNKLRIESVIYNPMFSTSIGLALKGFEN